MIPSKIVGGPDFSLLGQFNFGAFSKLGVDRRDPLDLQPHAVATSSTPWARSSASASRPATSTTRATSRSSTACCSIDSLAAVAGGAASCSSATTYIESGSGVAQGGRTGMVGVTVGVLFLLAMFFSPIAGIVPANATAPALIIVGYLMMATLTAGEAMAEDEEGTGVVKRAIAAINFGDVAFGIPAVLTMTIMPLTYSITNGIGAGFLSYTLIRITQGKAREISWMLWIASVGFLIYFLVPLLQAKGWV